VVSSTQWFMVWVYLEINTLRICYLFSKDLSNGKYKLIFIVIYYRIQVLSSFLILLSVIKWEFFILQRWDLLFLIGVLIKIGVWPFHSWYLKIIDRLNMNFSRLWLMMTWQKLIPLFILLFSSLLIINNILFIFVLVNLILSLVYLKNFFNVKSVLGFSSINSNSWLIVIVFFSLIIWKLFLLVYSLRIILIMFYSRLEGSSYKRRYLLLLFLVFNMGGLPPMVIFWTKVLAIKSMLFINTPEEVVILLLIRTCYIIFFYLYIILISFINISLKS